MASAAVDRAGPIEVTNASSVTAPATKLSAAARHREGSGARTSAKPSAACPRQLATSTRDNAAPACSRTAACDLKASAASSRPATSHGTSSSAGTPEARAASRPMGSSSGSLTGQPMGPTFGVGAPGWGGRVREQGLVAALGRVLVVDVSRRALHEPAGHRVAVADQMGEAGVPPGAVVAEGHLETTVSDRADDQRQVLDRGRFGGVGDGRHRLRCGDQLIGDDGVRQGVVVGREHPQLHRSRSGGLEISTGPRRRQTLGKAGRGYTQAHCPGAAPLGQSLA